MMEQLLTALCGFFGGFGMPAYPEDSVPEYDAGGARIAPPYITVQLVCPEWRESTPFMANVYDRANDYKGISSTVDAIAAAIGEGTSLPCEGGAVYIWKSRRFCQFMPYRRDPTLKRACLSMTLMAHITENEVIT